MTMIENQIDPADMEKINQLRKLVREDLTEYYDTDFNLLRWIQGHHSITIPEIARKLKHHLQFRKCSWDVEEMHNKKSKFWKHPINEYWVDGTTQMSGKMENVIVFVEQCGYIDYSGMLECYNLADVMKARLPVLEKMLYTCMEMEKKTGKQGSVLFVMDLTELQYNKKLYDLVTGKMKELAEFMAEHYVELIKYFVVINVPSFIYALWTAVKVLLPERTKNKVRMFGSNWRSELLELCDEEACCDYWSDDKHTFTGSIPRARPYPLEKYYSAKKLVAPKIVEKVDISAGKAHIIQLQLKKGDMMSYWMTANKNVGFGIFLDNQGDDDVYTMPQMVPNFTWMPGPIIVPCEDKFEIKKDGTYKFWLSNLKSWWSTVTVQYKVTISDANGNEK